MAVSKPPTHSKARLTYDAVEHTLSYTNIGHVDNTIEVLGASMDEVAKKKLKYTRGDLRPVFNDLTDNAKELLKAMRQSKVVLSGFWVCNFFKLGYSSRKSDYGLYCIVVFMSYIMSIGVNWLILNNKEEKVARLHYAFYIWTGFQLIRGTRGRNERILDIQLMWRLGYSDSQA